MDDRNDGYINDDNLNLTILENHIIDDLPDHKHIAVYAMLCRIESDQENPIDIENLAESLKMDIDEVEEILSRITAMEHNFIDTVEETEN